MVSIGSWDCAGTYRDNGNGMGRCNGGEPRGGWVVSGLLLLTCAHRARCTGGEPRSGWAVSGLLLLTCANGGLGFVDGLIKVYLVNFSVDCCIILTLTLVKVRVEVCLTCEVMTVVSEPVPTVYVTVVSLVTTVTLSLITVVTLTGTSVTPVPRDTVLLGLSDLELMGKGGELGPVPKGQE